MTAGRAFIQFARRGGLPPRDDELLRIADDGSFTGRRTVGGLRIGTFDGRLAPARMTRLRTLVAALDSAGDVTLPTPRHGATETLEAGGRTLQLGSNESPVKPWRALIDGVRKLLQDEAVDSPRAAIELAAGPLSARLVHAGAESLDVDLGSIAVRVVRIAEDGTSTGRWNGFAEGRVDDGERLVATPAWVTTHPGWAVPVPFDHGLALVGGDSLQVWVEVDLRESDATRHGQLYARVEGGR